MPDNIFDSFGVQKGLATKIDFQGSIDNMMRLEQFKDLRKLQREQKAQYYASRIQRGQASTEYNSKRLQPYYDGLNKELGDFLISNPNWEQDVSLVSEYNEITDKYLNNPILREELEVQKNLEMIRADRYKMSEEHFQNQMEQYDSYDGQEFDPNNPTADSKVQFRFTPETTLSYAQAVNDVSKNIGLTRRTLEGDEFIITRADVTDEALENGYAQILANPTYKKSLDSAWQTYMSTQGDKIYTSQKDFGKASLRNTKTIGEISRIVNPNAGGGVSGAGSPRIFTLLDELAKTGTAKTSWNAITLTDAQKPGKIFDPGSAGAIFLNQKGAIQDYEWNQLMVGAKAITASEMKYIPENNSYYVKTRVSIPKTNKSEDAIKDLETDKGFVLSTDYYNELGLIVPSLSGRQESLVGDIWLPATINPNRYLSYEDTYGKSMKQQLRSQQFTQDVVSGFNTLSDLIDQSVANQTDNQNQLNQLKTPSEQLKEQFAAFDTFNVEQGLDQLNQ